MNNQTVRQPRSLNALAATCAAALTVIGSGASAPALADNSAPPGRSIGYVISDIRWAVYQTKEAKEECPQGLAELGPGEQYKLKFPNDGTKRKFVDTALASEMGIWWPAKVNDQFPFHEAGGTVALGLNLDGKTKPTDFTSPEGEPGIDNQLYRVIGCIGNYRDGGSLLVEETNSFQRAKIDRMLIELTDVDSLINDDELTLTTYRGRDELVHDALGKHQPGGTQRLDVRWGKPLVRRAKAKIVDGVLTTEPMEFIMPADTRGGANYEDVHAARFKLKLTPEKGEGIIGGYFDIETFYNGRNRNYSTQHQSYGKQAAPSVYKELRKWADAYPDPKTGVNTAISGAFTVKLVHVHILRSGKEVAEIQPEAVSTQLARRGVADVGLK